jgi:hypothetical protein
MTTAGLARRLLRHRWRSAALLCGLVAVATTPVVGLAVIERSVHRAVLDGLSDSMGGRRAVFQILDREEAAPVLAGEEGLDYVRDQPVVVGLSRAETPATMRSTSAADLRLGRLTSGRWPTKTDEVAISRVVAAALDVSVGDVVQVSFDDRSVGRTVTAVVGSSSDPDQPLVLGLDTTVGPRDASTVLTDRTVTADPELSALLERRVISGSSVRGLVDSEAAALAGNLAGGLVLPWPGAAMFVVALVAPVLIVLARRSRPDTHALRAAGMGATKAFDLFGSAALAMTGAGLAAGIGASVAVLRLSRGMVSHTLGQDWTVVEVPWVYVLRVSATVVGAVCVGVFWLPRRHVAGPASWATWLAVPRWVGLAVIVVWPVLIAAWMTRSAPVGVAGIWGGAVSAVLPFALPQLQRRPRTPSTRRLVDGIGASLVPIGCVVAFITWVSTSYSADYTHAGISSIAGSVAPQPPGSLLLYKVPAGAADVLAITYGELGGKQLTNYVLPVDADRLVRAADVGLAECLLDGRMRSIDDHPPGCWPADSVAPLNIVAFAEQPSAAGITADPSLIDDGLIGVITFTPGSANPGTTRLVEAVPDGLLGGNMPGAVIDQGGPMAVELGVVPGDARLMAFLDFATLDAHARARFRSAVRQVASGAQVVEDSAYYANANTNIAIGRAVAVVGSAVLAFVIAVGGGSIVEANNEIRRTLVDIGSSRRRRRLVSAHLLVRPLGVTIAAAACGRVSAWITGVHDGSDFGTIWMLPAVVATVAWLAVGVAFASTPGVNRSS